jgi:excisionase family DNA binding protein
MKRRDQARPGSQREVDPITGLLLALDRRLSAVEDAVGEVRDALLNPPVDKEWYSTSELAEAMGVTQYTVQERWANQGRIKAEKDPDSGKWRIPASEYRRLVKGGALRSKKKYRGPSGCPR